MKDGGIMVIQLSLGQGPAECELAWINCIMH